MVGPADNSSNLRYASFMARKDGPAMNALRRDWGTLAGPLEPRDLYHTKHGAHAPPIRV